MAERDATVNIKYKIDPSSARRAVADTERVSKEIREDSITGRLSGKREAVELRAIEAELTKVAENARKRRQLELDLLTQSQSALQKRIVAIKNEQEANKSAIEAIRATGISSSATAKKIAEYRQKNQELAKTLDFITNKALPNAQEELKSLGKSAERTQGNLKASGKGIRDFSQLVAAVGILSGSEIGQSIGNIIALGNALKAAGGVKTGFSSIVQSITSITPATVAIGVAAGVASVAFGILANALEESRLRGEAYGKALIESNREFVSAQIALARGDTNAVFVQLKKAQDERLAQILQIQRLKELEATLNEQTFGKTLPDSLRTGYAAFIRGTSDTAEALQKVRDELKTLEGSTFETAITQRELTDQLLAYGFTIEEIEQAIADLDKTTDSAKQGISELTKELLRQTDLNRNRVILEADLLKQSEESLNDRANAIRLETQANLQAIEALRASGDTSEEVTQKIREYEQANEELAKTLTFITSTAIPKAIADARAETAKADALRTRTETIRATEKFNADVERLNEQNNQELLAIEKRRTDELTRIAKRYADDTIKALNRLNDDLLKARTRFNLGEIDAQVKANQAEIDATRKHLDAINDIRQKAQDDELDALNDLDFKRAFETRRGINRQIADAQKTFSREARERQINQDRERQDRLIAYQRAQADAKENYQKELQLAKENQQQALAEAKANNARELAEQRNAQAERIRVLQEGYIKEIELARLNSAQRLALQAQTEAQLLAQSQRLLQSFSRPLSNSSQSANIRPATQSASTRPITPQNSGASVTVNISGTGNPRAVAQQIVNLTKPSGGGGLVK